MSTYTPRMVGKDEASMSVANAAIHYAAQASAEPLPVILRLKTEASTNAIPLDARLKRVSTSK